MINRNNLINRFRTFWCLKALYNNNKFNRNWKMKKNLKTKKNKDNQKFKELGKSKQKLNHL